MVNRDLLKEAIADAKAVKETAIANAKAALEEKFNPIIREKLAAKLAEMDEEDVKEVEDKEMKEAEEVAEKMDGKEEVKEYAEEHPDRDDDGDGKVDLDEMDLDELLAELDNELNEGADGESSESEDDEEMTMEAEGEEAEGEEVEFEDEEIDLDDMSEDDLKAFIEDVIADMVKSGELEAGEEFEAEGDEEGEAEGEEEIEVEDETEMTMEAEEKEDVKEEEMDEMKKEIEELKKELNEINLLNSKLLYVNKIFRSKNLTENQKAKVLGAFDKATTVAEVKLVFETLSEGLTPVKAAIKENLGSASKVIAAPTKTPILEVNNQFERWQKLAGIK